MAQIVFVLCTGDKFGPVIPVMSTPEESGCRLLEGGIRNQEKGEGGVNGDPHFCSCEVKWREAGDGGRTGHLESDFNALSEK